MSCKILSSDSYREGMQENNKNLFITDWEINGTRNALAAPFLFPVYIQVKNET